MCQRARTVVFVDGVPALWMGAERTLAGAVDMQAGLRFNIWRVWMRWGADNGEVGHSPIATTQTGEGNGAGLAAERGLVVHGIFCFGGWEE